MDFSGLVTAIGQKGWRVALPVALASGAVLIAHKYNWPEPDILRPWLGTATVAGLLGLAVTAVAFISWIGSSISDALNHSKEAREKNAAAKKEYDALFREVCDRIAALQPFQRERFLEILRTEAKSLFLIPHGDGPANSLIGPLIHPVEMTMEGHLCRFHPIIQHERQKILDHF